MQKIIDLLFEFGISVGYTFFFVGIFLFVFVLNIFNLSLPKVFELVVAFSPAWLPIVLFVTFYSKWLDYVNLKFRNNQNGRVTLEIKLPEEIYKSPEAMEMVLTQMYYKATPDNLMETYIDGKHPLRFGLEIVSTGGNVHFYINTPRKKFKDLIETQLYAQYPGIEVRELPVDYTAEIVWDDHEFEVFGLHFGSKKDDVYPIKTYYDFGMADNPKEEEKHDPITSIVDLLGSIGPHERIWFQFLIKAHKDTDFRTGTLLPVSDWKSDIDKEIEKILAECKKRGGLADEDGASFSQLTEGEKQKIKALERSRSKFGYDTAIRVIYAARKGHYQIGNRMGPIIALWQQFADNNMNQIGMKWRTDYDYSVWQDPSGRRRRAWKKMILDHYKRRYYRPIDHKDKTSVMTSEELATIFHLPGKVLLNPNVARIPSARAEAPPNLPTGN